MRHAMEDGISEVLSSVVEDVGKVVTRDTSGAQVIQQLLSAPWLHALLKIYECLLQFQRLKPSPFLPFASGLSYEIFNAIQNTHCPSPEAMELLSLLSSPHVQALLSSHDRVAQSDYGPILPPLPEDFPEDEEAMRIVCLVKNNQPLSGGDCRGSVGADGIGRIRSRWSSLRRLTLERLIPARRAWSGEELTGGESEARLLPLPRGGRRGSFMPHYQSTASCHACLQSPELRKKGLHRSAPSVFSPAACTDDSLSEKPKLIRKEATSSCDYAYLPPPVPAYGFSLPSSPVLYKKGVTAGHSRNILTPGRTTSRHDSKPPKPDSVSLSPATLKSTRQQGVSTIPDPARKHTFETRLSQEEVSHQSFKDYSSLASHYNRHQSESWPQPPNHRQLSELTDRCSADEHRSPFHTAAGSSQDVHDLGQKMAVMSEMMTDRVEENVQALNLLTEVVNKLQGLIVAKKSQETSPPCQNKRRTPPLPPPRVSSVSPKVVRKPPTPYPRNLSPSSSSSSSSSSATAISPFTSGFAMQRNPKQVNGKSKTDLGTQRLGSKGNNGQGATIKKIERTGEIYIARVIHGGLAERSGLLHPGDLLVEVNGNSVEGLEPEQVIQILINSQGTILFKVIPNAERTTISQKPVYMRAMVDYCPLQDSSIPCPDAGTAFYRGDLLEVLDQSDSYWWQARKLPCDETTCAGLIPSAGSLRSKQREHWWHQPLQGHTCIRPLILADNDDGPTHADENHTTVDHKEIISDEADTDFSNGIYLAGFRRSFRLWRRTSYRKRRQSCTTCSPNRNALSTPYEEVVLYQRLPQEMHRLIILIGATGVGVNELRKRFVKMNPVIFQAPVPHTTRPIRAGEQSGREYHFVSKEIFEYMVCNHRFVEYGECKGQLYGTSTDAIDDILKQGRMCIVDVEPHSIQSLRTKKLKPYVVFIKPPSPERLRQTRKDARITSSYTPNKTFTEEDFVELEHMSKLIEVKYKQFFDRVLVNDDLKAACMQLCSIIQQAQNQPQWVPVSWSQVEE